MYVGSLLQPVRVSTVSQDTEAFGKGTCSSQALESPVFMVLRVPHPLNELNQHKQNPQRNDHSAGEKQQRTECLFDLLAAPVDHDGRDSTPHEDPSRSLDFVVVHLPYQTKGEDNAFERVFGVSFNAGLPRFATSLCRGSRCVCVS